MDYLKVHFDTKKAGLKESAIRIYPLVCCHLGARQCDIDFLQDHIQRIKKDPNGYWVYLGDGGECALKSSKGDIYTQVLGPQEQQDVLAKLLKPIQDRGLAAFQGNHGRRVDKESGLSWDKTFALRMGIPYLGLSAFMNLVVNRSSYDLYFHHGSDSGTSIQSKVSKAEGFGKFVDADAIFTAHSHVAMELQPAVMFSTDNGTCEVRTKFRHQFICGSCYDSRTGYAEEKGYSPLTPAYLGVTFDGRIIEGTPQKVIKSEVFRSQHPCDEDHRIQVQVGLAAKS